MKRYFTFTDRLTWETKPGGQVRSYTSKVSEVSTVSKMSKQGAHQSQHSLRPLGEGGRRPDEGLTKTGRLACTTTLETAKEARSTIIHDVPRHEAAEPASCKSLVP